jgi:hypothetical protein
MDLIQTYNGWEKNLDGFFNLTPLLNQIRAIADDYRPAAMMIAFVLLVFATLRGFLQCEVHRFFQNLLQVTVLVCLIGNTDGLITLFQNAANGLAAWPVTRQINVGNLKVNFTTGQRPVIEELLQVLQEKTQNPAAGQSSAAVSSSGSAKNDGINVVDLALNAGKTVTAAATQTVGWLMDSARNLAWQALFGAYFLSLLLCKAVIILMAFLQGVLVILFGLYAPIGFAELSIPAFKHKGQGFFLTFVGLLCWPIGWSFVNAVTLQLFQALPAPQNQSFPALIAAIVASVPILLWVFVGHVLCPTFAQKVVIRGGGAIQAMAGAMVGVMALGTANIASGLVRRGASSPSTIGSFASKSKGRAETSTPTRSAGASSSGHDQQGLSDARAQPWPGDIFGLDLASLWAGNGQQGTLATQPNQANSLPHQTRSDRSEVRGGYDRTKSKSPLDSVARFKDKASQSVAEAGARMIDHVGEIGKMIGDEMAEAAGDPVSREYQLVRPFRSYQSRYPNRRSYGSSRSRFKQDSSERARDYLVPVDYLDSEE